METLLPIGTEEWNKVLDEHSKQYSGRTVLSIRRRYQNLHRKNAPTGSPNMPDDVRQAKRIKYKIGKRAELCDGTEEFHLEDGFQPDSNTNHTFQSTVAVAGDRQCTPRTQSTVQPSTLVDSTTTTAPAPAPAARTISSTTVPPSDGSTITPTKRTYTSRVSSASPFPPSSGGGDKFLQTYQLSLQQERLFQERESRRWERERIERQEAREDMMKMIGVAVSQFANAIGSGGNHTNLSAVFAPRQAPRFEGVNGEPVQLPNIDSDDQEEDDNMAASTPPPKKKRAAGTGE
mmetsp:Transcript_86226/g.175145  ORF Transcript_86226/g.175145 Transcript_86226/m.175145 type:complete len:290 (+) Transcript_86226:2-871(+)